ncbi:MAG: peroxiredoxin [Chloroflexota bacterium]
MNDTTAPTRPAAGDDAPAFALLDDSGTRRELSDERGHWVVLFFYPRDFTSGCTIEVCEFRDLTAAFAGLDAVVWGVSVLDSASKAAFKQKHALDFALLADEDHAVAGRYGVWVEKSNQGKTFRGIGRATFLIDPQGAIARVWPTVKPEGHAEEVLEALRSGSDRA